MIIFHFVKQWLTFHLAIQHQVMSQDELNSHGGELLLNQWVIHPQIDGELMFNDCLIHVWEMMQFMVNSCLTVRDLIDNDGCAASKTLRSKLRRCPRRCSREGAGLWSCVATSLHVPVMERPMYMYIICINNKYD